MTVILQAIQGLLMTFVALGFVAMLVVAIVKAIW